MELLLARGLELLLLGSRAILGHRLDELRPGPGGSGEPGIQGLVQTEPRLTGSAFLLSLFPPLYKGIQRLLPISLSGLNDRIATICKSPATQSRCSIGNSNDNTVATTIVLQFYKKNSLLLRTIDLQDHHYPFNWE